MSHNRNKLCGVFYNHTIEVHSGHHIRHLNHIIHLLEFL